MLRRTIGCFFLLTIGMPAAWADAVMDCTAMGNSDSRLDACTRLIELEPNNAIGYENRGFVYQARRDYDRAIADYSKWIAIDPNNAEAYNKRAAAYAFKIDYGAAIADYNKVIALDPNFATAYYNRGEAYEKKGDKQRAIADYRKYLTMKPQHTFAQEALSRLGAAP